VRQINLGLDFFFAARGTRRRPAGRSGSIGIAEVDTDLLRFVLFQRTGVRLFLGYPDQRKRVKDSLAFDFHFAGKIVDSNLTHPAFRFSVL